MAHTNPDVKSAVIKDVLAGMSQRSASKKWGVTQVTIAKWRKQLGIELSYHMVTTMGAGHTRKLTVVQAENLTQLKS